MDSANHSSLWIGTAVAAVLVPIVYNTFLAKKKEKPWPCVPGALPILGNKLDFTYMTLSMREQMDKYGNVPSNTTGLLEVSLLGSPLLLVCNNTAARDVVKLRPNKLTRSSKVRLATVVVEHYFRIVANVLISHYSIR